MLLKIAPILFACAIAWGVEDSWQKVKDLAAGSDIRVFKKGSTRAVSAKMASLVNGKLMVVVKKEQVAIDRADVERIDYHPPRGKGVKTESSATTVDGYGTNTTWSSGTSWTRDGWQTVYRR
jgi:hypothetical protein